MRQKIARCICAVLLAFVVSVQPFVCVKKAEAFAPAVGAAAAAGALAAELGITTEALMTGLMVVTAAGTGVYLLNSADSSSGTTYGNLGEIEWRNLWNGTDVSSPIDANWSNDYQHWRLGNGKSWDDLTSEEKANWDTPAEYVQGQWLGYLLGTGLISEVSGGGDFEPTPEPDKETDPDGNSGWHKLRNVLTVLGVSGAAVAADQAVDALASNIAGGIKGLLFAGNYLNYQAATFYHVGDYTVKFLEPPLTSWQVYNFSGTIKWAYDSDCAMINTAYPFSSGGTRAAYYVGQTGSKYEPISWPTLTFVATSSNQSWYANNANLRTAFYDLSSTSQSRAFNMTGVDVLINANGSQYLVPNYKGSYVFQGFGTYSNGQWLNDYAPPKEIPLPFMPGAPDGITQNVDNNDNLYNFINNYTYPDGEEGDERRAVTVPDQLDNPDYTDIVRTVPTDNTTPIPDDEPVTPPDPNPGPNPDDPSDPTKPDNYDDDFTNTANKLLSNPFDQLFPFCLISDLRDLTFLLLGGGQVPTSRLQPGTLNMQSDTPTSQLNGVHKLTIDFRQSFEGFYYEIPLDPLHDLLRYTRFTLTAAAIMLIVIESFNFFLKRGA